MKKRLFLIAIPIIFQTLTPISQVNAAVKAGSACVKAGTTAIASGKTFTCIKSGKKLVWDSGTLIQSSQSGKQSTNSFFKEFDSCSKLGLQVQTYNDLLECRRVVENKLVWIKINSNLPTEIKNINSVDPISNCQISDKRTSKNLNWPEIAFPAVPAPGFTSKGNFKIVVVGIDFPDVKGEGKPSDIWQSDISRAKGWMDWFSSGKVKYDISTFDQWIHATQPSKNFNAETESIATGNQKEAGGLTPNQIATAYLNLIGKTVDISNVAAIWIYYPKSISEIHGQWTSQLAGPIQTEKYGTVNTFLVAVAKETYDSGRAIWEYFLHEMLHRHGLFGHSPKVPVLTGIMSTFNGWTDALLPWDALVLDWQSSGDFFCVNQSKLNVPIEITLVPLEREQKGFKAAIVKLSDSQLLIVDSHRRDKWSTNTFPGQYGVMLTLVDTSKNSNFEVGEDGNAPSTSLFLKMLGTDHGKHSYFYNGIPLNASNSLDDLDTSGRIWTLDLNYLMYLGESNIFQNIKVSLIKTGDNDTIKLERIG